MAKVMRRANYPIRPHVTKNHFQTTISPTAGTESVNSLVACVEAPSNRSTEVPAGCTLRSVVIDLQADAVVAGRHQCLLWYRPAAENLAVPIASYFDSTDPLTEEAVKIRRLIMGTVDSKTTVAGASAPTHFQCKWRGAKHLYDGDDIVVAVLDEATTVYDVVVWTKFTQ